MGFRLDVERLRAIERYCRRQIDSRQFAGIAWRIDRHGNSQDDSSGICVHGFADHDLQQPLAQDTIYRMYSMTKPVISVLCLMLIEKGYLRLGDPVCRWIPAFNAQRVLAGNGKLEPLERALTVEDLLTHRAGLSYDFLPDCLVADEYRSCALAENGSRSLADLVSILASTPLAWQPGYRWYYSYATDVLAHLLERVSDQPLRILLRDFLTAPLGMEETDFQVADACRSRLADMFGQRQLGQVADSEVVSNRLDSMCVEDSYPSDRGDLFARGGIGLFSTMADYTAFVQLMLTGKSIAGQRLLSDTMLDMMWKNRLTRAQMPIAIGNSSYPGYGWGLTGRVMVEPSQALHLSRPGEGGWAGAASTYFWVDRKTGFTGIVMAQYLGSSIQLGSDIQTMGYAALDTV